MTGYGNTLDDLMTAFGLDMSSDHDWEEFKIFWASLNDTERTYYRTVRL